MNKKEKQVGKISPHDHPFKPDPKDGACKVCGCLEGTHGKQVSLGFREKLSEILASRTRWGTNQLGVRLSHEEAVSAILKLIREEVVPDAENLAPPWSEYVPPVSGWNRCREVMLRKLGGEDE